MKPIRLISLLVLVSLLVVGASFWMTIATEFAPAFTKVDFHALPAQSTRSQATQRLGQPLEVLQDGGAIILRYSKPKAGAMGFWCYELIFNEDRLLDKRTFLFWD
jgi:hypothetical protein